MSCRPVTESSTTVRFEITITAEAEVIKAADIAEQKEEEDR